MKKVLILAVAVVMCASVAMAQSGGHIGLYSDEPGYSDCNVVMPGTYQSIFVYVVHTLMPEANTSSFMLTENWTNVFGPTVTVNPLCLDQGDLFTGITITYGQCRQLPFWLATLEYAQIADEPACSEVMEVVAHPSPIIGSIQAIDCENPPNKLVATGGLLTANGDITCPCIIGTEETSWSKIKALYK